MNDSGVRPQRVGDRAYAWWKRYCLATGGGSAVRARLRRCHTATDALGELAAVALVRELDAFGGGRELVALDLARILAHVTEDGDARPMRAAGWRTFAGDRKESDAGDERPALSETRFRRLLREERGDDLTMAFIRLTTQFPSSVRVATLAEDFWYWNDRTRQQWAFDYYAAQSGTQTSPSLSSIPSSLVSE